MTVQARVFAPAALILTLCVPASALAQESTGTRIGKAIGEAVSAAFPAVDAVIKAIWPRDREEKKKADDAKKALEQARKDAIAAQRPKLDEIKKSSAELVIIRKAVTHCAVASGSVLAMQTILGDASSISDGQHQQLNDLWGPTQKRLTEMKTLNVETVRDSSLRDTLDRIRSAASFDLDTIATQLKDKRHREFSRSLDRLEPVLAAAIPLAGLVIGDLASGLERAADAIAGAAGASTASDVEDRKTNLDQLKRLLATRPS
jgi:hypothetical protein